MAKNIIIITLAAAQIVLIGSAAFTVFSAQAADGSPLYGQGFGNGGPMRGNGNGTIGANLPAASGIALSDTEKSALLFMYEEEKLARDVYNQLYSTWKLTTFSNIARAEQNHMNQLGALLTRYGLKIPAQTPGVFSNADLQKLYTQLVAQGKSSSAAALTVGGAIEEIDILDLQKRLTQTTHADIKQVFNNLIAGSENHLRAFARNYSAQTGSAYSAQTLPADQVTAILNGSNGAPTGPQGNGRGRRP